jgi:hypothetical protein
VHDENFSWCIIIWSLCFKPKMNTPAEGKGNRYMAGNTPFHASAYIPLLLAGTPSSSTPVARPERKSQGGQGRASKHVTRACHQNIVVSTPAQRRSGRNEERGRKMKSRRPVITSGAVTLRNAFVSGGPELQWYEVLLDNPGQTLTEQRSREQFLSERHCVRPERYPGSPHQFL